MSIKLANVGAFSVSEQMLKTLLSYGLGSPVHNTELTNLEEDDWNVQVMTDTGWQDVDRESLVYALTEGIKELLLAIDISSLKAGREGNLTFEIDFNLLTHTKGELRCSTN
mgnify:CR=1 FL=1